MYTKKDPFSLTWCGLFIYFFALCRIVLNVTLTQPRSLLFCETRTPTSTRFLSPGLSCPALQPTFLIPVRDPQPPTGHAKSQGMCPCYSPSKVCYGLVTGSPEPRHLLAGLSEILRPPRGKRRQERKSRLQTERERC